MIDDLVDFARSRTGSFRLEPAPVDLVELLPRRPLRGRAPASHAEDRADPLGDSRGEWDADRIAQVVQNLADNAIARTATRRRRSRSRSRTSAMPVPAHREEPPGADPCGAPRAHLFRPFPARTQDRARNGNRALYIAEEGDHRRPAGKRLIARATPRRPCSAQSCHAGGHTTQVQGARPALGPPKGADVASWKY